MIHIIFLLDNQYTQIPKARIDKIKILVGTGLMP
jgi:hypothetical protein